MRPLLTAWLMVALVLTVAPAAPAPKPPAELVETRAIWDRGPHNAYTDLVRFKDRWFCVCREGEEAHSPDGALRVLTSADGVKWESAALLTAPTLDGGWPAPKLSVTPDGRLLLSANGVVPKYTVQPIVWSSKDGREWGTPEDFGEGNWRLSRIHWHKGTAYVYGYGCICGIVQTMRIASGRDVKHFKTAFEYTMSGEFPGAAALVFDGDAAYCLMSRNDGGRTSRTALIGTARAPYTEWTWQDVDARISYPNLMRLPDGRIVAATTLYDKKVRTSLCWLDPAAGTLKEFLELPTGAQGVGLVWHDEHLWVSYHATRGKKVSVHLAKVKVARR